MLDMSGRFLLIPEMSSKEERNCTQNAHHKTLFGGHKLGKCPALAQNFNQSTVGLPDILSGMLEMIALKSKFEIKRFTNKTKAWSFAFNLTDFSFSNLKSCGSTSAIVEKEFEQAKLGKMKP